jgi:hypothetical protein
MADIVFDLEFLNKRLKEATEPLRTLDGDIWWIVALNDDLRDSFAPSWSHILTVMQREGSPGNGLSKFFDSSARPPSKLDYAPKYTSSVDDALHLVGWQFPKRWPDILRTAISKMGRDNHWHTEFPKEGSHSGLALEIVRALISDLLGENDEIDQVLGQSSIFPHFDLNIPMPAGVKPPRED